MLCGYFQEEIPASTEEKKEFLLRRKIALWDMAVACEVEGSADSSIKNVQLADLTEIFDTAKIEKVLLNGTLAFQLFVEKYRDIAISYQKMPSTSPANPRYNQAIWYEALDEIF